MAEELTRVGKYQLISLLGRGGMGEVYKAVHPDLGHHVAVKLLRVDAAETGNLQVTQRFQREARAAARINHAGVVRVHDVGAEGDLLYMVMDFVEGRPLTELIANGGLPVRKALRIAMRSAQAIQAAHDAGVIHRDIKPGNIMIDAKGEPRVLDFGIARRTAGSERLTRSGDILGTPLYMSPEQVLGTSADVDAQTDVYSLGLVLYELLTGKSPFEGPNVYQVIKNIEVQEVPPPSKLRPEVGEEIDAIVMKAIARNKADRYVRASDLARALAEVLRGVAQTASGPAPTLRRAAWKPFALGGAVMLAVLIVLAILFPDSKLPDPPPPQTPKVAAPERVRAALAEPDVRSRRDALVKAIVEIGGESAEALYWRGIARKHVADFAAAYADIQAAYDKGWEPARRERFVAWLFDRLVIWHRISAPPWLRADMAADLYGWADELESKLSHKEFRFFQGCAALAQRDGAAAAREFESADVGWLEAPDREVLLALAWTVQWNYAEADKALDVGLARRPGYAPLLCLKAWMTGDPAWRRQMNEAVSLSAPEIHLSRAVDAALSGNREVFDSSIELAAQSAVSGRPRAWQPSLSIWMDVMADPRNGISPEAAWERLAELENVGAFASARIARLLMRSMLGEDVNEDLQALPDDGEFYYLPMWRDAETAESPLRHYIFGQMMTLIGRQQQAREALVRFLAEHGQLPVSERTEYVRAAHQRLARIAVAQDRPLDEMADHLRGAVNAGGGPGKMEGPELDAMYYAGDAATAMREGFFARAVELAAASHPSDWALEALRHARAYGMGGAELHQRAQEHPAMARLQSHPHYADLIRD